MRRSQSSYVSRKMPIVKPFGLVVLLAFVEADDDAVRVVEEGGTTNSSSCCKLLVKGETKLGLVDSKR